MLEKVKLWDEDRGINVEAYTDGYSYDEEGRIYLLSVAGPDSAVKAIISGLLSSGEVEIENLPAELPSLFASYDCRYRVMGSKLRCGFLHQIMLVETFFNPQDDERLIFVEEGRDFVQVLYEEVSRCFPVPLIPQWSKWIYSKAKGNGVVTELKGNVRVAKLKITEQDLDELISEGVRTRQIRF
jgi:hypothetical protein